jgi:hypothetical protein
MLVGATTILDVHNIVEMLSNLCCCCYYMRERERDVDYLGFAGGETRLLDGRLLTGTTEHLALLLALKKGRERERERKERDLDSYTHAHINIDNSRQH